MLLNQLRTRGGGSGIRIFRMMWVDCAHRLRSISSPSSRLIPSTRTFVSVTSTVLEKHTTKVPTMGDSITEGTIVEWAAQIGQKVEEEDVLALIETDKVTVDIKATKAGVITQQFGAVDDTVEVGADLCEIDTDAIPTVESTEVSKATPAPITSTPEQNLTELTSSQVVSVTDSKQARIPSIKFLGKDGWSRALLAEAEFAIPANYGRLAFSEEEMEALLSGGASVGPEVKEYSSGAIFSA